MKENEPVQVFDIDSQQWSGTDTFVFVRGNARYVTVRCIKGPRKGDLISFKIVNIRSIS